MLTFQFTGAKGTMTVPQVLTSGMVGKHLLVEFSPEWEGLAKTLVFSNGSVTRDVIFDGNPVTIPAEVLEEPLKELTVGAYGLGSGGNPVIPTVRARGPVILPGVVPSGDPSTDPTLPVWAQILAQLGDLDDLETETRENLVAAVNEVLSRLAEIPEPDKTLTLEGVAADAEAVGQRFTQAAEQVAEQIREIQANLDGNIRAGSVVHYGAKGDGATDDTGAFQTALTENRVVYVPGGTYRLSGELVIGDNCCLELSQDTVLEFTQTSGNCVTLGMLSTLKGNHATVKVPYEFDGHVLNACSNDHTTSEQQAVPPWSKWDPQWKSGRYVTDLNICKADSRGFHYAVNPEDCKGTAVYISADNTAGMLTFMWGIRYSGLRIAGAFACGIHARNLDGGWVHEMRIDAFIDACQVGVCLEDCSQTYISAVIQPRRAYTQDQAYVPYAKHGIKLVRSKNTDLSGSRVWDWNGTNTLWTQDNEYQHISMYGDCSGTILNDFVYHSQGDTRKRIYTDNDRNLETLTILQEPVDRWFKVIGGEPYFTDGLTNQKLLREDALDAFVDVDFVKNFTDVLATATEEDGTTVFNKIGYQAGKRFTSLGTGTTLEDSVYYMTTGFIRIPLGSTIYGRGLHFDDTAKSYAGIVYYNENRVRVASMAIANVVMGNQYYVSNYKRTTDGFSVQIPNSPTLSNLNTAYVRLVFPMSCVGDYPMLAIDEQINYTMEGFLAESIKVKGENVIGTPGQTTPDWVATKKTVGGDAVVISEQTISNGLWKNLQMTMQPDLSYDVTFNGEVYVCEARTNGQGVILGNNTSMNLNDYPFCISWAGGSAVSGMFFKRSDISYPVTLKVTDHPTCVYDKLPEGYLPECVVKSVNGKEPDGFGNVEVETAGMNVTAEVGQTIVVKEVDANGKPAKWEAAEYQPRTHWIDTRAELVNETWYLGAENLINIVLTEGETYYVTFNGVEYTCVATALHDDEIGTVIFIGNGRDVGLEDTGEPFAAMCLVDTKTTIGLICDETTEQTDVVIRGKRHIPIPVEYLTNALPYRIVITGQGTDESPYVCNETVANVESAYNSGREVVVKTQYYNDAGSVISEVHWHLSMWFVGAYGKVLYFMASDALASSPHWSRLTLTPNENGMYDVTYKTLDG